MKKFSVNQVCICPFNRTNNGYIPQIGEYPYVWCVVDESNSIAVDICQELQYDYVKTMNGTYFLNDSQKLIKE